MRRLKTARIAVVGHAFEGMTDLMIDPLQPAPVCRPDLLAVEPEKVSVAMEQTHRGGR